MTTKKENERMLRVIEGTYPPLPMIALTKSVLSLAIGAMVLEILSNNLKDGKLDNNNNCYNSLSNSG